MTKRRERVAIFGAIVAVSAAFGLYTHAENKAPAKGAIKQDQTSVVVCPGVGIEGLKDEAARLFQMADTDHDGRLSKQEALGVANFVVGGFFFRSDTNNDGIVTPEEAKEARRELVAQQPMIGVLLKGVRGSTEKSPYEGVARMFDIEYGKPLRAAEAREAVRKAVDAVYSFADDNKDNYLTMAEARGAAVDSAGLMGKAAFGAADANKDGTLNQKEFESAVLVPARAAFGMADANDDGKLSPQEARDALNGLMNRIGVSYMVVQKPMAQRR